MIYFHDQCWLCKAVYISVAFSDASRGDGITADKGNIPNWYYGIEYFTENVTFHGN